MNVVSREIGCGALSFAQRLSCGKFEPLCLRSVHVLIVFILMFIRTVPVDLLVEYTHL